MATIYEVARLAGVSAATVSRVLNGTPVSPAYAEKVRQAADALDFTPNRAARTLRRRSSEAIALLIPDIENPFFTTLARGVEDCAQAEGYSVVLCNTDERLDKEADYLKIALSADVAGIILAPASDRTDLTAVVSRPTPVVAVDRPVAGCRVDAVRVDDRAGARAATKALFDRGFSLPACIAGPADVLTSRERVAGWRETLDAHHIDLSTHDYVRFANSRVEGGSAAIAELLRLPRPPDSVFVGNNLMALGALQWMRTWDAATAGFRIAAFGDLPFDTLASAGAAVVHHPAHELGVTAASLLIERIRGDTHPARTVVLSIGDPGAATVPEPGAPDAAARS